MRVIDWFKSLLRRKVRIDVRKLPSQGFFYRPDFGVSIKRAEREDVEDYEQNYDRENIGEVLARLKRIVQSNVILDAGYEFSHIKSIDIVYLFLEIVRLTKGRPVSITYFDEETGRDERVDFGSESFNYFVPDAELMEAWDAERRCFNLEGYMVSLPTIGIENSLTQYLIEKSYEPGAERFNDYSYNFTFFLEGKHRLKFDEIDNLIQIFNSDLDEDEREKVDRLVDRIKPMQRYSVRVRDKVVEMSSKLNLEKIWK